MSKKWDKQNEYKHSSQHGQIPTNHGYTCWSSIYSIRIEPSPEDEKRYADEKNYKDKQLRASKALNRITFFAASVALVGLLFVWRQLAISTDTAKRQFRAYVVYENGTLDISKDGRSYTVSIEMKNSGQTPAYSATSWFNTAMMERLPDPFRYFCPPYADWPSEKGCTGEVKFGIPPDEGATDVGAGQSVCLRKTFPITSEDWASKVIYVWGYVTYTDQFQRGQYAAFVQQTANSVTKEKPLKLANVLDWTTDPEDYSGRYIKGKRIPKFPWPQEPQKPREPSEASFQGACPAN